MMKTIMVVSQVSFQLGQVTLLISRRTSWKNSTAATYAAQRGRFRVRLHSPVFFVTSAISTLLSSLFKLGRSGGTRTHGPRFWRPMLYQLSYTPMQNSGYSLRGPRTADSNYIVAFAGTVPSPAALAATHSLQDLRDDAGADGAAAFADGEAQLLFHRDRNDQFDFAPRYCRPASPSPCPPAA